MLTDRSLIREGMAVFSSDGEKLGKVLSCEASTFTIEKGFFFPKDYVARYDDIADVTGDDIRLAMTKDSFVQLRESGTYGYATGASASETRSSSDDVRVPVAEEELDVLKREREAGEVRLRKDVVTDQAPRGAGHREEVHVERSPVSERREALPGEKLFEDDSVSVPNPRGRGRDSQAPGREGGGPTSQGARHRAARRRGRHPEGAGRCRGRGRSAPGHPRRRGNWP